MAKRLLKDGVAHIATERCKQEHRHSPKHDASHDKGELLAAAVVCTEVATAQLHPNQPKAAAPVPTAPTHWPWSDEEWQKLWENTPIENMAKAGALLAAECDRVLRADG